MIENSSSHLEIIDFEPIFEDRPMKTISVLVSIFGAILAIPLLYGIIWFEENNHFRTLINQVSISSTFTGSFFVHIFLTLFVAQIIWRNCGK